MQLLIGIEVHVFAARPLLRQPGVETGWNQAVGALRLVGGADRQGVRVLVLDMLVVAAHPAPFHRVRAIDLDELLPEIGGLERARFAAPAASVSLLPLLLLARAL